MIFGEKDSQATERPELAGRLRTSFTMQRILKLFQWISYYLVTGTLYCWMTVIVDKLSNTYAEILFYPVRNFPNCTRILIVLTAVMLRHYTLAILTAMCFFGEIIWVRNDIVTGQALWNSAVFGFSTSVFILIYRLAMNYIGEWLLERQCRKQRQKTRRNMQRIELIEFIRMAEDGLVP